MRRKTILFSTVFMLFWNCFISYSLSLPQAQTMMLFQNLDINIARQEYCQKDYELSEAKSAWYPSLDASASYSYQNKKNTIALPFRIPNSPSGPLEVGINDRSDIGLDLTYPVTAAIVNRYNVQSRNYSLRVKYAQNMAQRNQLSFKLGMLYFLWDLSFSQYGVKKMLVTQLEATVAHLKNMQAGGMSSASKVLEAQAALENARLQLLAEENKTDSLRLELINFIRCDDSAIVPAAYDFNVDSASPTSLDALTLDAYRPEIAALDLSIDQLNAGIDALAGRKYPSLFLTAGYHYGKPELNMSSNPDYMGYAVAAVQVKYNIFDGNKIDAQLQQTQQQVDIARSRRQQLMNDLDYSLKTAKMQFTWAQRQKKAALLSLQASDAAAVDAKNSLDAGIITSLDYCNVLVAKATAELAVKQARFHEKAALLKVYYAAGKELKY